MFDYVRSNYFQELLKLKEAAKIFDFIYKRKIFLFDDIQKHKIFRQSLGKFLNYNRQENENLIVFKEYVFTELCFHTYDINKDFEALSDL